MNHESKQFRSVASSKLNNKHNKIGFKHSSADTKFNQLTRSS